MLDDFPAELQRFPLLFRRFALCSNLDFRVIKRSRVRVLHEQSAFDGDGRPLIALAFCAAELQQADVLFLRQDLKCLIGVARRDDDFKEDAGELPGCFGVHFPVEGDDAAEDRDRIGFVRGLERVGKCSRRADAAWIHVLHRDGRRIAEFADDADGGVRILDIIVGKFLPVELLRAGDRELAAERLAVERGLLVRVLPVAERLLQLKRLRDAFREFLAGQVGQITGDERIVGSRMAEHFRGESAARFERCRSVRL